MYENCRTLIESLGVYLPPRTVSTAEILQACKNKILLPVERLTGIRFRRMAGEQEFSIDLAKNAISTCLNRSKYNPEDIELLICCNISRYDAPNFHMSFEPSTSIRLKKYFGFKNAMTFDISNACAGMFTGINIVDSFIKAGLIKNALVVSGEYITHLTLTALKEIRRFKDSRLACLTLGDSGAAMVLEGTQNPKIGFHEIDMYTLGRFSSYCIAKPTQEHHGGAIMFTDSLKLHTVAIKESVKSLVHVMKELRWPAKAFHHIIMHQTARTAINKTSKLINNLFKAQICNRRSMVDNLSERGNTSTTTHIVALWDNILNNKIHSGENVLFAIQASGITIGTAPYTFDDLPDRIRNMESSHHSIRKFKACYGKESVLTIQAPRVRVESIGTIQNSGSVKKDAVELAKIAGENCLQESCYNRNDIGLLIHSGVYRNDFICEPAIAAMIAGKLRLNDEGPFINKGKTFAFDIFNGAVGFLDACYNAIAMIRSTKFKKVMVVASEIENNAGYLKEKLLGIMETGSAMILDESDDGRTGFGRFIFRSFTEYIDDFTSHIAQSKGRSFLEFMRNPDLEKLYSECVVKTVQELLNHEKLNLSQIKAIFPPQISSGFILELGKKMNVLQEKFVDITQDGKDLFTSSLSYPFQFARDHKMVRTGDIGLIINVGSGIQVGCALYYF